VKDLLAGEHFVRVVGRRRHAPEGTPPPVESRAAMTKMADYRTRAPKGVFIYASHGAANRDRDAWTVEAMVEKAVE
jgi:hypothetical protein